MSVVFTRHDKGQTGRADTPQEPARQTAAQPITLIKPVAIVLDGEPKTVADFIKKYGQAQWEKFRATILSTPSTINYLQASDAYAKAATVNLLLITEAEITKRVIDMWKAQFASQDQSLKDGVGFVMERWAALWIATSKFTSAITGAFVGSKAQMQEQFKGGTVYWVPKKFKPAGQKVQSPLGPVPVAEMNDPVGKIAIPSVAAFWFSQSSKDVANAIGGTLPDPPPWLDSANQAPMLPFLQWAIKQGSTLFRKDVADYWNDCGMTGALAAFGDAVQGRLNLLQNTQGLQNAIANNLKYLADELTPQTKASEKARDEAQQAALAALTKVGSGVPVECATAQAASNFKFAMAAALLQAQSKLNEAVKAGLTTTGDLINAMEQLQIKLANAQSKAEKELIAAQIIALAGKSAADLSRVGSRLGDRKGKIDEAARAADEGVQIADAHGLDGQAARQAANTLKNQGRAAGELNVAHGKTLEAEKKEVERIVTEVLPDAGQHAAGAAGEIVAKLREDGDDGKDSGSGALWILAAAAAAAKFFF